MYNDNEINDLKSKLAPIVDDLKNDFVSYLLGSEFNDIVDERFGDYLTDNQKVAVTAFMVDMFEQINDQPDSDFYNEQLKAFADRISSSIMAALVLRSAGGVSAFEESEYARDVYDGLVEFARIQE